MRQMEIDDEGLDSTDRKLLAAIIQKFASGPVGVQALAAVLAEEVETIEDVYEPFLLRLGFLDRTPQGRIATESARAHLAGLGYEIPPPRRGEPDMAGPLGRPAGRAAAYGAEAEWQVSRPAGSIGWALVAGRRGASRSSGSGSLVVLAPSIPIARSICRATSVIEREQRHRSSSRSGRCCWCRSSCRTILLNVCGFFGR